MFQNSKPKRYSGKCKRFYPERRFGYISIEGGGEDIWFHQTEIRTNGYPANPEGQQVEFEIASQNDGRVRAINVSGPNSRYINGRPANIGGHARGDGGYNNCSYNQFNANKFYHGNNFNTFNINNCNINSIADQKQIPHQPLPPQPLPPKPKETMRPKKPLNAYLLYQIDARRVLYAGKPIKNVAEEIANKWKAMSQIEQKPWRNEAAKRRKIYDKDMKIYMRSPARKDYEKKLREWESICAKIRAGIKDTDTPVGPSVNNYSKNTITQSIVLFIFVMVALVLLLANFSFGLAITMTIIATFCLAIAMQLLCGKNA